MGYDGRGLGVNGQGIINPIEVKRQPHKAGLGYTEIGESSKSAEARKFNNGGNGDGKQLPRRNEHFKRRAKSCSPDQGLKSFLSNNLRVHFCVHCGRKGHRKENCWDLHPEL